MDLTASNGSTWLGCLVKNRDGTDSLWQGGDEVGKGMNGELLQVFESSEAATGIAFGEL